MASAESMNFIVWPTHGDERRELYAQSVMDWDSRFGHLRKGGGVGDE
jgi:hypothetical protein